MSLNQVVALLIVVLGLTAGCRQGPERVPGPDFSPGEVASRAFANLDNDGDGSLSQEELTESPGLLASLAIFDADHNQEISHYELAAKLGEWKDQKSGLISVECDVSWKGRPLKGATVALIPESYFESAIPPATGRTDDLGHTELSCDPEHLPEKLKTLRALKPGIYRVEVTHPKVNIPSEYNTDTRLGRSVSLRDSYPLTLDL